MLWAQDVDSFVEVELPSGVRYTDLRLGGGQSAVPGYLIILDFTLRVNGELIQVLAPQGFSFRV